MNGSKRNYFLPKFSNATKLYAWCKIILITIYVLYIGVTMYWTVWIINYYQDKMENEAKTVQQLELCKTHIQFFLFTAVFALCIVLVCFVGLLRENATMLYGYSLCLFIEFLFEVMGAFKSYDQEVLTFKLISASFEPLIVIFTWGFAMMIKNLEQDLVDKQIYEQKCYSQSTLKEFYNIDKSILNTLDGNKKCSVIPLQSAILKQLLSTKSLSQTKT